MFPGDSFSLILFLLLLQHQLDEELLQLLVTVVDAELFKAAKRTNVTDSHTVKYSTQSSRCCRVFFTQVEYLLSFKPVVLEDLKTIDVQHPDDRVLPVDSGVVVPHLDDVIDPSHNPAEQTLVHGLRTTQTHSSESESVRVADDWLPAQSGLARRQWTVTDATAASENVTISVSQTFCSQPTLLV